MDIWAQIKLHMDAIRRRETLQETLDKIQRKLDNDQDSNNRPQNT